MKQTEPQTSSPRWRSTTSTVLLVVLFFVAAAANFAIWVQTTISDTDTFVAAFAPLPDDPSVAEKLGQVLADATIDTEQTAANISADLPDRLQVLAVPIATSLNELAADAATRVIESDPFVDIWEETLRGVHVVLIAWLDLRNEVNDLVADVNKAADAINSELEGLGIAVAVPEVPTVGIVEQGDNATIVRAIRFIYTTGWVFPLLFLVVAIAAIAVAFDRRRATVLFGGVLATAMVFDLIVMRILRADISGLGRDGLAVQALRSAWDTVTTRLHWQTWIILAAGLIVMGVARYAGDLDGSSSGSASDRSLKVSAFLERWGTAVNVVTVVVALGLMLFVPSITLGLALIIAVLAAVIISFVSLSGQSSQQDTRIQT